MRPLALLLVLSVLVAGCKRETSEAVAEAKGAAADAKRAADEAAAKARAQAQATADQARAAAAEATATVHEMGQSVQQGVNAAGQSIREVGEGNVVNGRLTVSTPTQIVVAAPPSGSAVSINADDQTRWVSKGGIGAREGVPTSSSVRVTYIVRDGRKVATQVEQVTP